MSFRVVLQQYLASMRERDELDILLPELLVSMGHTVLSRPQKGTRQAGVDCLSEFQAEDGPHAFLFVLKQGDVTRKEFFASPRGIEPSVREAKVDYVRTRLPQHLTTAQKHIVLVSTGRMREEVSSNFASLTKEVAEQPLCDLAHWGEDRLAELIEEHLLHDALLLGNGRSSLRKAIATIDNPPVAQGHMSKFFSGLLGAGVSTPETSANRFLKQCSAATVGWSVFGSWCRSENNLKPGLATAEYLLLAMWSSAQRRGLQSHAGFLEAHDFLVNLYVQSLLEYFVKVTPQLLHVRALHRYRPTRMQYMGLVFDEMGRLGTLLLLLAQSNDGSELKITTGKTLTRLFEVHPGCLLPYFDGQSIDVSLALAGFLAIRENQPAGAVIDEISARLSQALDLNKWLPIDTDSLDDGLSLELKEVDSSREFFEVTTLAPMLATTAAFVGNSTLLASVRERLETQLRDVNMERWFPTTALEVSWGMSETETNLGVSRSVEQFGADCEEEIKLSIDLPPSAAPGDSFEVVRGGRPWLLAMSARLFRHPLPTWYFDELRGVERLADSANQQNAPEEPAAN